MFVKYPHIERLGNDEVTDILDGTCLVFPKIDGTNASVWQEDGQIKAGSRRRELTTDDDNAGFYVWVLTCDAAKPIADYLTRHPNHTLYGEWLVPHSLKTYRADAWRRFYVFDILDREAEMSLANSTTCPSSHRQDHQRRFVFYQERNERCLFTS